MIKRLIYITSVASILFFAISFLTILFDFGSPFWKSSNHLDVGFPFTYYEEFFLDYNKHHGWNTGYLILDALIIWVLVFVIWRFKK